MLLQEMSGSQDERERKTKNQNEISTTSTLVQRLLDDDALALPRSPRSGPASRQLTRDENNRGNVSSSKDDDDQTEDNGHLHGQTRGRRESAAQRAHPGLWSPVHRGRSGEAGSPTSPGWMTGEEEEEVYQMLRVFFNQYVAFSFFQLACVLSIVVIDVGSLSGLVIESATGESWFSELDLLTLFMFTMEVAVNIFTFGKRFFHSLFHKLDLFIVLFSDVVYFLVYCTSLFDEKSVTRTEVSVDITRSVLRVIRLVVVVVRLNDAFTGPMETLHRRVKAVHRANSKLIG
ncbi:unnamed protein product [Amoebophrya sp. A120]|nr:unnamed protein product [Amoebophrya sp. A120]|eukprot:GSA120T00011289001.1